MRRSFYKIGACFIVFINIIIGVWCVLTSTSDRIPVAVVFIGIISVMIRYFRTILKETDTIGGFAPEKEDLHRRDNE